MDLRGEPGNLLCNCQFITGRSYIPVSLWLFPVLHATSHLIGLLLGLVQFTIQHFGSVPKLGTVFQMKPHESWIEGGNIFSLPTGYLWRISVSQCTLTTHFCNATPLSCAQSQSLRAPCRAAPRQSLPMNFAFVFIQLHKISAAATPACQGLFEWQFCESEGKSSHVIIQPIEWRYQTLIAPTSASEASHTCQPVMLSTLFEHCCIASLLLPL